MGFDGSHTNFYSVKEVVLTCLKQHGQRHSCGAYERKIAESLNIFPRRFSFSLNRQEEFTHGHLSIILVKLRKEPGFQVNPRTNGAIKKARKSIKSYPLMGADEKSDHNNTVVYHVANLRPEVIDVLIW